MPTSDQRRLLHLYIRPARGPVSFMELDVDRVEMAALEWGGSLMQRDQVRMQEIMRQITQKFPGVQVVGYQNSIAMLVARLSTFKDMAAFNFGVVLEAPGSIQEPPAAPEKSISQEQIQALEKRNDEQKKQLAQAITAYENAYKEVGQLKNEVRRLKMQQSAVNQQEMQNAQQQLYQASRRVEQLQKQLATLEQEIQACGRENGMLKARYEQLEMDRNRLVQNNEALEARLEGLKNQKSAICEEKDEAVKAEEQLRQVLQDRDKQIEQLQARLQALITQEVPETELGSSSGPMMLG